MLRIQNGIITECNIEGVIFKKEIISLSHTLARPQTPMAPEWATVHNSGSGKATAQNLSDYINRLNSYKSWHISIDEKTIIQQLPLNEIGWANGDGPNGPGNRTSISIEVCERDGANRVAILFIIDLLRALNLPLTKIATHQIWSGKYCPSQILPIWNKFMGDCKVQYSLPIDVNYDRWSAQYIKTVVDNKIMKGYPDKTYGPTKELTREETAVILNELVNYLNINVFNKK